MERVVGGAWVTHCFGDLRVFHEFEGKHTAGDEHYSSERLNRSIDLQSRPKSSSAGYNVYLSIGFDGSGRSQAAQIDPFGCLK